jgi:hypothetical protein
MKRLLVFLALTFGFKAVNAQEKIEQYVKAGTRLMYRIDLNNRSYDMRVTVKSLSPFVFDYDIIDSANSKGTITHTSAGMANGIVLHNNFTAGNKVLDEKTTSLWLSKRVFKNFSKHTRRPVMMFLNGLWREPSRMGYADGEKNFMVRANGRQLTIQQEYARPKIKFGRGYETTGTEYLTYYNSSQLPIILKLRTNFYMELLDIIND